MDACEKKRLAAVATRIRMDIIEGTFHAKSGHPGGSLSIADMLTYLYWKEMRVDPKNPRDPARDRLVLSKGHAAPALYGALAEKGYFDRAEIQSLRHVGAMLQGHPDMNGTPGVDMSSGSLGQGVSAAVGMALGGKLDGADYRVYSILGDGEIQEGQVWEAAMFASAKGLDNLCIIVDNNDLQIDGTVREVNNPHPIPEKFAAFGFRVIVVDGHDFDQLEMALSGARATKGQPTAIIMRTTKGKGVSFMENQVGWHGSAPNKEQYDAAMAELTARLAELEG